MNPNDDQNNGGMPAGDQGGQNPNPAPMPEPTAPSAPMEEPGMGGGMPAGNDDQNGGMPSGDQGNGGMPGQQA